MARRRVLRWIGTVLVVCLGIVAVLLVVATTPWFKDRVRRLIVSQVTAVIDGEFDVQALSGSIFRNVTLSGVVIRQAGDPTIQIESLTARYDLVQIALGRFAVDAVEIHRPRVRLIERADGWNVSRMIRTREQTPGKAPWSIVIGRLEVSDGDVAVEPLHRRAEEIADLTFSGAFRFTAPVMDLTLERLSARDVRTGLQITRLDGELSVGGGDFSLRDLLVTTPSSTVRGRAALRGGDAPNLDVDLEVVPVTAAEFAAYLPSSLSRALVFSGKVSAAGPLNALLVSWTLDTHAGATTGRLTLGLDDTRAIRIQGTATGERLLLASFTGPALDSTFTARANIDGVITPGALAGTHLTFAIDAPDVALAGYEARVVHARGALHGRSLRVAGTGQAYGAVTSFDAAFAQIDRAEARAITVAGHVRGLDLQKLPQNLGAPMLATAIAGQYAVATSRDRWRVEMTTDTSRIGSGVVGAGTRITAESQPGRFAATVDGAVTDVDAAVLRLPPGHPVSINGTIRGQISMPALSRSIPLSAIDADLAAHLGGSTAHGMALQVADVDLSLHDGLADIRQLDVRSSDLTLSAKGLVAIAGADHESQLTYEADVADLTALKIFGVNDAKGALHAEGVLQGAWEALTTEGTFGTHELKYGTVLDALVLKGTFKAALPDQDWSRATGELDAESVFLTVRGYELERLALSSHYREGEVDLSGRFEQKDRAINLDATLLLHPDHREIHLRQLGVAGPGSPWQLGGDKGAVIRYGSEQMTVDGLVFVRDQERVEASGTLAFAAGDSDLKVRFQSVQVGDVYTMAVGMPRVTGVANGEVALSGTLAHPTMTATLDVADGKVAAISFATVAAAVNLRERRLAIDARIEESAGNVFTVKGEVPVAADAGAFDVRVQSPAVSLGLIQAFTSRLDAVQGHAAVNVRATGSLAAPSLNGNVAITGGGFLVTETGVAYRDLTAEIRFDGQRVATSQFSIADDDGHLLTVTGGADVFANEGGRAFDLAIATPGLHVLHNDLGEVEVRIDARAEGRLGAPRITGRIGVLQGRMEVDEVLRRLRSTSAAPSDLRPDAGALAAAEAVADAPVADTGFFSRAAVDLAFEIPDAFVLRGRDLRVGSGSMGLGNMNLTIGGDLHFNKSPGTTTMLLGSVEVVRGFYEFQGRRFLVERGSTVTFRGADFANPTLNVIGERDVQGVLARVQITGSLRRPRLALSSNPPLDEGDVLSLIVFNQPINQLAAGQQVDLIDRAGEMAVGTLATSLGDSIGRALDVDLFEIRAPGFSGEAGQVDIGRQINERLFVGFRQEFGAAEASRLSFEYQLTDALRILTSVAQGVERAKRTGDRDTAGIDLIYLRRY